MLILHDPVTLAHKTVELLGAKLIPALESPERITAVLDAVQASGRHDIQTVSYGPDSNSTTGFLRCLSSTHDAGYLRHLRHAHEQWVKEGLIEQHEDILPECFHFPNSANKHGNLTPPKDIFARPGFYSFDMSTGICSDTYESAIASAHLAFQGVQMLIHPPHLPASPTQECSTLNAAQSAQSSTPSTVLALCRPPGHHCDTRRAGGYCYLNNAVIAVEAYRQSTAYIAQTSTSDLRKTPRITILDLDFHHGNGTQEAFYADPDVQYISIHGQDEYPYYTGSSEENGTPESRADDMYTNVNIPLKTGSSAEEYMSKLHEATDHMVSYDPDFFIISLGFDTFHLDPLGGFKLDTEDYADMASLVRKTVSKGRAASCLILLEGGYVIDKLGGNMVSFLSGWEEGWGGDM